MQRRQPTIEVLHERQFKARVWRKREMEDSANFFSKKGKFSKQNFLCKFPQKKTPVQTGEECCTRAAAGCAGQVPYSATESRSWADWLSLAAAVAEGNMPRQAKMLFRAFRLGKIKVELLLQLCATMSVGCKLCVNNAFLLTNSQSWEITQLQLACCSGCMARLLLCHLLQPSGWDTQRYCCCCTWSSLNCSCHIMAWGLTSDFHLSSSVFVPICWPIEVSESFDCKHFVLGMTTCAKLSFCAGSSGSSAGCLWWSPFTNSYQAQPAPDPLKTAVEGFDPEQDLQQPKL